MALSDFRSYQLAVGVYRRCLTVKCPAHLRSQLLRASSSVALNLAEGAGRRSPADQRRCYGIALGSLRETEAILGLLPNVPADLAPQVELLSRHVFRLCHPRKPPS